MLSIIQFIPRLRFSLALRSAGAALALLALALFALAPEAGAQDKPLVISNATVIDVRGGRLLADQVVVISAGRIQQVGSKATVKVPAGATTLDATGKYVIPGLWDSHVHTRYQGIPFRELFLVNGVTSVRDTAGPWSHLEQIKKWKKEIADGTIVFPRIVTAGPLIDGPNSRWTHGVIVKNPAEGRQAVRDVKERGGDFIKIYDLLDRETVFAIIDEAKKNGMPFAGHLPFSVSAGEASDAGMRTMEHLAGFLLSVSTKEEEFRKNLLAGKQTPNAELLATYSEAKATALIAKFAKNGTVQDPTLSLPWTSLQAAQKDPVIVAGERLEYIPAAYKEQWSSARNGDGGRNAQIFEKYKEIVLKMQKAGVPIITGTDTVKAYLVPGYSLQDELQQMVEAGLSPIEVLRAATMKPAEVFQVKDLGTVEQGKFADLLVLDGNPLSDIKYTRQIFALVVAGRLVDKQGLAQLARDGKKAAADFKGPATGR